jgi:hypothetical protein
MTDLLSVNAYWGPLPESMEECANRLEAFLASVAGIDSLLATWFETGDSRSSALESKVEPRAEQLWDLLLAGRNREDFGGAVIQDLGFNFDVWNGQEHDIALSVRCGSWTPHVSPNSVILNLPDVDEPSMLPLFRPGPALALVRATVSAWAPSRAAWTSRHLKREQGAQMGEVVVGWATYLSAERVARSGKLPDDVQTEACGEGLIITIGDDPTDVPLDTVMAVREALGPALLPD